MSPDASLNALAQFLCDRRNQITREWEEAVRSDPQILSADRLSHEQLIDHLPRIFDDLADTLRGGGKTREHTSEDAHSHGEHRWWQGYKFTELLREVSIVRRILFLDHIPVFAAERPGWNGEPRKQAESIVHAFFDRTLTESAQHFVAKTEQDRAHYRALFESTAGAYVVIKPGDLEVVAVSDSYLEATSLKRESFIGRRLFDVFPEIPGDPAGNAILNMRLSLERVFATGSADALPIQHYPIQRSSEHGGGVDDRYWSCVNSPVFGPGGEIAFIMLRAEDVTPVVQAQQEGTLGLEATQLLQGHSGHLAEIVRRTQELVRSNQQLRHGEERFKLAVAIAQMGTFEIDLRTDAVVVNEEAREIYGWPPNAQLTFSQVQTHFHSEDRDDVLRAVAQAFDPKTESDEFDVEQRIVRTNGEVRWIRVRARAFFDGTGSARRAVTCVGTFLDITERKQHESALLESEARFRHLADSIPQLAWMANPDGWIFWYNQRWHEFTGTTPEEMEGWGWQNVHDPQELPRVVANWKAALAEEQPWEDTFPLRRHDGEFRVHLSRARPFRDSQGKVVLWFGTNTDITELVRAEEAARLANRAKDHFIATLSHELRTPLTPVLATIMNLTAEPNLPPNLANGVELIRRNIELEARLIDDLLDVMRISKGKLRMERQPVALHPILHDAQRICEGDISKKRLFVELDLRAPNDRVDADAPRLLQAFWNLLQNAVKFTPPDGQITIRTRGADRGMVRAEISDSGIGIEAESLPQIFEPFGQANDSISQRFGGLGLGLALSKALIEAHGGTITAASPGRDQGTTFAVELATTDAKALPQSATASPNAVTHRRLRILLVEDHEDTRRSLLRLIERWG
ncbi:MAG: PAS domain S-box protein, partial [Chthoniobacterales bacterium]|nr:PAS domain S-box protein [Chthoniobacterales bacterium]